MPARSSRSAPPSLASDARLTRLARLAARRAHAPYSGFPVGAAVLTATGKVFTGGNVENASYGLCNCAERSAIFAAVSAGERELRCVVVYTPTARASAPCGACRQVIHELGPQSRVLCVCDTSDRIDTTIKALLPRPFELSYALRKSRTAAST